MQEKQGNSTVYQLLGIEEVRENIIKVNLGGKTNYILFLEIIPINFRLKSSSEQSFIIDCYQELLKIMKTSFQITTIAKKADLNDHLAYMTNFGATELQKARIEEYCRFVKEECGKGGVSRRFILAVSYPPQFGLCPIWSDVLAWGVETENKIRHKLLKANTELAEPTNKEQFVAEIFYEILNRQKAEKQPFIKMVNMEDNGGEKYFKKT